MISFRKVAKLDEITPTTYSADVLATMIPGCPGCHAPHPRASTPERLHEVTECPKCGTKLLQVTRIEIASAKVTLGFIQGIWVAIATMCFKFGNYLRRLSKDI